MMTKISNFWLTWLISLFLITLAAWLRLSQLGQLPPAPYWEEVALGYDAFSIVQTGKDHHGNPWPIVAFESFGDWKPSGYFYAAAISIKVFGLSVWATRLPAAVAGIFSVVLIGLLIKLVMKIWQIKLPGWPIMGLGLAAISPWGILFSRAAWEVMLATCLFLAGLIAWLMFLEAWKIGRLKATFSWMILAVLLAVASMYTYHALRLITPLMFGWTTLGWCCQLGLAKVWTLVRQQASLTFWLKVTIIGLGLILLWPLITNLNSPVISQRFAETSLLTNLDPIHKSNALIEAAGDTSLSKLIYHRYWFQAELVIQQFLKHLNLGFLFLHGDANPRHSIQYFGQLYYLDAVFGLLGAVFIWRKYPKLGVWLLGWWLIGTLPAAVSTAAPHALRTLPTWPVWVILISFGLTEVSQKKPVWLGLIGMGYLILLSWFWQTYTKVYPQLHASEWQAGYAQMYQQLETLTNQQPNLPVFVTRSAGRPAMYYWFYHQTDPVLVQAANSVVKKDQGEYLEFGNINFVNSTNEIPTIPAITAIWTGSSSDSAPNWQVRIQ